MAWSDLSFDLSYDQWHDLSNDMINVLNADSAQVRATQTES